MPRDIGGHRLLLASLAVIALAVAVGGFLLGTRARAAADPPPAAAARTSHPAVTGTPGPTATATPARSLGPADLGPRAWNALTGGECLRSFASPWRPAYEVVVCRTAHAAQLTRTVVLPEGAYPTRSALTARLGGTCQAAVSRSSASRYRDLRVTSSYPTAARWAEGDRTAYCFVFRAGGGTLTGGVATKGG